MFEPFFVVADDLLMIYRYAERGELARQIRGVCVYYIAEKQLCADAEYRGGPYLIVFRKDPSR